ncbi:MAG: DUF1684 domain-containing protein [Winogradskyella sp.]
MRNFFILIVFGISILNCAKEKTKIAGETKFQKAINAEYKDASTSPLKAKDLKRFKGLDFFELDSTYVTTATLKRMPNSEWFSMKTTTNRVSQERIFGILTFQLKGKTYQLNVYQGKDTMQNDGFEDYLFLPFLDHTNGETSYGGGRYIDLRIPNNDTIVIDFNTAYNPYCAYNAKYSCPIVPNENYLDLEIKAGVKVFKKH